MAKKKIQSAFFCQNCGTQSPKWLGKCPQCNEWNTFVEEIITKSNSKSDNGYISNKLSAPILLENIDYYSEKRIVSNDSELNRVLGGGIVPGSLILLGGDPGIGKSTLLLQFALSSKTKKILYVSGEESEKQIKMRAERINKSSNHCYILTETSTGNIFQEIRGYAGSLLSVVELFVKCSQCFFRVPKPVHFHDLQGMIAFSFELQECLILEVSIHH